MTLDHAADALHAHARLLARETLRRKREARRHGIRDRDAETEQALANEDGDAGR